MNIGCAAARKAEAILESQFAQPHTSLILPMAATLGITATSNVYHSKILNAGNHLVGRDCQSQGLQRPMKEIERNAAIGREDGITRDVQYHSIIKYINKVYKYFLQHCNVNIDNFLTCNPHFKHTTFKFTCEV